MEQQLETSKKERTLHLAKAVSILLAAGFLYYIFVSLTGLYIPCIFRLITGLKCPGCGISHMLVNLAHFRVAEAFAENPFAFVLLPFAAVYGIYRARKYIFRNDRTYRKWENKAAVAVIVAAVMFGIFRNITGI